MPAYLLGGLGIIALTEDIVAVDAMTGSIEPAVMQC